MSLTQISFGAWGNLKIEGYIQGKLMATKTLSGTGADDVLMVESDDSELIGDGRDATRVVLAVTDSFGNFRPFASVAIQLSVIRLEAHHQYLGKQTVEIRVRRAEPEYM